MAATLLQTVNAALFLFVLLNPFLMSIYLMDLIERLDDRTFAAVLLRAAAISGFIFCLFAITGDAVFSKLFQVRFASFLVFGGIVFLLIALRFVHQGPAAVEQLRGEPEHLAGAVAMPFMIGPGTVSASVLAGARLPLFWATLSIGLAMISTFLGLIALKKLHTMVKARNRALVDRYVNVVGRASALLIGTIAVDMILNGVERWIRALPGP